MKQIESADGAAKQPAIEDALVEHARHLGRGEIGHAHQLARALAATPAAPLMTLAEIAHAALAPVSPRPTFRAELEHALDSTAAERIARERRTARGAPTRWHAARALVQGGAAVAVIGITAALWWRGRAARAEPA